MVYTNNSCSPSLRVISNGNSFLEYLLINDPTFEYEPTLIFQSKRILLFMCRRGSAEKSHCTTGENERDDRCTR